MFSYKIIEASRGPYVQILNGANVIDECGPWESTASATNWANSYVNFKQSGGTEPVLASEEQSTIDSEDFSGNEGGN